MRRSSTLIAAIVVVVTISDLTAVRPARGSYVIDDVIDDVVAERETEAAGGDDVTQGARLMRMMLCHRRLPVSE